MRARVLLLSAVGLVISATAVRATVITVTPADNLATIVAGASPGDVIELVPGTYTNQFAVVSVPLTIEAVPGSAAGSVVINDTGFTNGQGIIENLSTLTVNNLTISGANGGGQGDAAAIRDHGSTSLTVNNSTIENSQDGILTEDPTRNEVITITNTNFLNNGSGDGQSHALYVGDAASLDVTSSTFCGTNNGHDIKSKATTTTVSGSTMYIGAAGGGCAATNAGAGVDAAFGGIVDLVNDAIIQGPANSNGALIIMGGESPILANSSLDITGTTLTGDNGASGHAAIGVNEFDSSGAASCIAPVMGSGNTISGLTTDINPAPCGSLNSVVTASEPQSLWLLLTAFACCSVVFFVRGVRGPQGPGRYQPR